MDFARILLRKRAPRCMGMRFRQKGRAPRCMRALPQNAKRAPRCMGAPSKNAKRALRCMRTLCKNAKRAPRCMRTRCFPHGPDWSPKMGPRKQLKTVCFKMFLKLLGAPSEHPSCAHKKMDQPKWTPKSAHSKCSKYLYYQGFLTNLFFGGRFWHALLLRPICKICKVAMVS